MSNWLFNTLNNIKLVTGMQALKLMFSRKKEKINVFTNKKLEFDILKNFTIREYKPVPILYGKRLVKGNTIYYGGFMIKSYEERLYLNYYSFVSTLWQTLAFGKLELLSNYVYVDKREWTYSELNMGNFNDGTEDEKPYLYKGYGEPLAGVSRLKGISHYWFEFTANTPTMVKGDGTIPDMAYLVKRVLTTPWGFENINENEYDFSLNIISVIYDLLNNYQYGAGIDSVNFSSTNWQNYAEYFYNKKLGVDFIIEDYISLSELLEKFYEQFEIIIRSSIEDYKIQVSYLDNIFPVTITDNNIINISVSNNALCDLATDIRVTYTNQVDNQYTTRTLQFVNEKLEEVIGTKNIKQFDYSNITLQDRILRILSYLTKKESYIKTTLNIDVSMIGYNINVGDVVNIDSDLGGISGYFRVLEKTISPLQEGKVTFSMVKINNSLFDDIVFDIRESEGQFPEWERYNFKNMTFPTGSALSNVRVPPFNNPAKSVVVWGEKQEQTGILKYTSSNPPTGDYDYTIIDNNKILLNQEKWRNTIEANYLGLLNVDTWETY